MKKITALIASAFLITSLAASVANSEEVVTNGTGGALTIPTATGGASDIVFNPSTNVIMSVATDSTAFAATAYHLQVLGKSSGKQFGMASDENTVFFLNIETAGDVAELATTETNAAGLLGTGDWTTM